MNKEEFAIINKCNKMLQIPLWRSLKLRQRGINSNFSKRGQFFLMAAIIIAGILFGITSITNVARGGSEQRAFYDLSEEVNFETKRVLDYGVYNEKDLDSLLKGFLVEYADYIAQEKVLFVFGNKDSENLKGI